MPLFDVMRAAFEAPWTAVNEMALRSCIILAEVDAKFCSDKLVHLQGVLEPRNHIIFTGPRGVERRGSSRSPLSRYVETGHLVQGSMGCRSRPGTNGTHP